jgi:immunity protein, SdpI family
LPDVSWPYLPDRLVMGKIRPNWFVGVRTPWTLSSKLSWTKTHRLAGWVLAVLGPLIALTGIIRTNWFLWATLAVVGAGLAWMVVSSYLVYRTDPNRMPPTGTSPG